MCMSVCTLIQDRVIVIMHYIILKCTCMYMNERRSYDTFI